jgi:membrane protein implicated in regulation of membrane protease activity
MPYRRFLVFNAIGGSVWAVAVAIAGYLAGASWERVQTYLGNAGILVLAGFVVAVLALLIGRRLRRRRRESPQGSAGRRRSRRQPEVEDRPAVVVGAGQVVADGDGSPVPGDDLTADRQPEA